MELRKNKGVLYIQYIIYGVMKGTLDIYLSTTGR